MITQSAWVLDDNSIKRKSYDFDDMRKIGPLWGGPATFQEWYTDNTVSMDLNTNRQLIVRKFHSNTNLHVPKDQNASLDRPGGIRLFEHDYKETFLHQDQLCCMMLIADFHDILLLLHFKVSADLTGDKLHDRAEKMYIRELKHAIESYPDTQFVAIDVGDAVDDSLLELDNFTCDTYKNVLELLLDNDD